MRPIVTVSIAIFCSILLAACSRADIEAPNKPAKVEPIGHEAELMRVTLTAEAERRLGISLAAPTGSPSNEVLQAFGEVVVPPLVGGGLPVTAATDLATLAINQARADGDIARVAAQARAAELNLARAEALVREEAGSAKARDDALAAALGGRADLAVAQRQRRLLGASVDTLGRQKILWLRVPVVAGDIARVNRGASATVRLEGQSGPGLTARSVQGSPSANGTVGSVDLYFAVPNHGLMLGQRVAVNLPGAGEASTALAVPASAIVYDIHGGEWVYAQVAPRSYERRRVEVSRIDGGSAMLARGLTGTDKVVVAGAAELFGTEFGTK